VNPLPGKERGEAIMCREKGASRANENTKWIIHIYIKPLKLCSSSEGSSSSMHFVFPIHSNLTAFG